jgi:mannan endo-1,4-beta-mannosidase
MKKNNVIILLTFYLFLHSSSAQAANHFYTTGAKLYDPCGVEFNIRGINYAPYDWGYAPDELLLTEVAKTGANTVRMSWYANNPDVQTHAVYTSAKLATALDACTGQGMLPIIELHDQTCQNDPQALISLADYYLQSDVKAVLMARQDKLILNIANESLYVLWADNSSTAQNTFKSTYNTIIASLRNAGYTCPLMIDAPDCGMNSDAIAAVGQAIITADVLHNTMFSAHAYWYSFANNDPTTMLQKLQVVVNSGIPFVLGEVANQQDDAQACQYTLPYQQLLSGCQSIGINWLAWSWNNDVCPDRQLTSTGNFVNLTSYGSDLVNNSTYGLKAKAIKSSYLLATCTSISAIQTPTVGNHFEVTILNENDRWQISSSHSTPLQVKLYSISGQLLLSIILKPNESQSILKPTDRGVYLLKTTDTDGKIEVKKILI